MRLTEIIIKNYRSIEEQTFVLEGKDKSFTYTLIGINESGKSSFLNAVALVDSGDVAFPRDFYDENKPIEVSLMYTLDEKEVKDVRQELASQKVDEAIIAKIEFKHVEIGVTFANTPDHPKQQYKKCTLKKPFVPDYYLSGNLPEKKVEGQETEDLNLEALLQAQLPKYFYKHSHYTTFWKSDSKHLISEPINLDTFAANPEGVSVPLYNCFRLAGVQNIKTEIEAIKTDSARRQNLQDKLGDSVTAHIKKVWPNHPIKIKFNVNNMMLEFLIEDEDVNYRAKTTGQRSDGFKQFISFLLTISAEHATDSFERSLLLLDEPETHLHPKAQEFLKNELIKLTKNNSKNNIVFFATHSNYMIDRDHIGRCYKVEKIDNKKTNVSKIEGNISSYAETNYDVFGILSSDYHNELYGILQEKSGKFKIDEFDEYLLTKGFTKNKTYLEVRGGSGATKSFNTTLPTYIRHLIHHPENVKNKRYTDAELEKSITELRKIIP